MAAFRARNPHMFRSADGEDLQAMTTLASCGPGGGEASSTGPTVQNGGAQLMSVDGRTGTIYVWGTRTTPPPQYIHLPSWLWDAFYSIPSRFLGFNCGTRYGHHVANHYMSATDDGIIEDTYDDLPEGVPPGFDPEEFYNKLNRAEKVLVWRKYMELQAADPSGAAFAMWALAMKAIRQEAETWASNEYPFGGHNDMQDALRHSYWQCRMTQAYGVYEAKRWGDAHEEYSTAVAEVQMDLYNNNKGRGVATRIPSDFADCVEGVRWLRTSGNLQDGLLPPPSDPTPAFPPPTSIPPVS